MTKQILNIVFSIILLPVNFCCAFWIFREAMNLTGMTFKEFLNFTSDLNLPGASVPRGLQKRQRFLVSFFREKSSDPQKSIRLLWTFGICTLPGLAALTLAVYCARDPEHLKYAFIGNLILVLINIGLVIWGRIYRNNHPLDKAMAEKLEAKHSKEKEEGKKNRRKNIIVYSLVGAFFFGMLLFFMFLNIGYSNHSDSISRDEAAIVLHERGYETYEIPVTYWELDENKLMYVCAGVKGEDKFEFYEYSDVETTDLVYNQISYRVSPDMEPSEREKHETELPGGNKMFTAVVDGVYHLVMYQGNTVVYAYSPDSLDEINDILIQIGYLKNR
jgi:hypothetical protein